MTTPFTVYDGSDNKQLTTALLGANTGISFSNIVLKASYKDAVNFYDGSLTALGIGKGLLLTSGTTPETSNTVGWFGQDNLWKSLTDSMGNVDWNTYINNYDNGDADINAVVQTVFNSPSYDATTLEFDFSVADTNATSISFDIVFGSDEFPEWTDLFVDSAVVMVNGKNYALFNHNPNNPLSVLSQNVASGYFQDNASGLLPIEYDGVSQVLKIVAPIQAGNNHIKIGIADTGDHIYDSGIFLANFSAGNMPGSGVVVTPSGNCTDQSDKLIGSPKSEIFDLKNGDDTVYAASGDDIVIAGLGNDLVYAGDGNDEIEGGGGNDDIDGGNGVDTVDFVGNHSDYSTNLSIDGLSVTISDNKTNSPEGLDTLKNVEYAKFQDGLFSIDSLLGSVPAPETTSTPIINNQGSVKISGMAVEGQTFSAIVDDVDGFSSNINYQWQRLDGSEWIDIIYENNADYVLTSQDSETEIRVKVDYVDGNGIAENLTSPASAMISNQNDFVSLLILKSPQGAIVANPLTTLLQEAIEVGYGMSPKEIETQIKLGLGISNSIDLRNYDPLVVLAQNPLDKTALKIEKIAAQVLILTSLSGDYNGDLLLSAVMGATTPLILNGNANSSVTSILGDNPPILSITGITLDKLINDIQGFNDDVSGAVDLAELESVLQDAFGNANLFAGDFSISINQAPTGTVIDNLGIIETNHSYLLDSAVLLNGFKDPNGDVLVVNNLVADSGTLTDNGNGTWFYQSETDFNGSVQFYYDVVDNKGGSIASSQMLIVEPPNHAPELTDLNAVVALENGVENMPYVIADSDLLAGWTDSDGDTLSINQLYSAQGSFTQNANNTWTFTPNTDYFGVVSFAYDVIDGKGGVSTHNQSFSLLENINVAPVITNASINNPTATYDAAILKTIINYSGKINFSDADKTDLHTVNVSVASNNIGGTLSAMLTENTGDGLVNWSYNYNAPTTFPTAIQTKNDSFELTFNDGHGNQITQIVSINSIVGTKNADNLNGSVNADILIGGAGVDSLNGGGGSDLLLGGASNDVYFVNDANAIVFENMAEGTDIVNSSIDYALTANVENLTLTGNALFGTGNELANTITGNASDNVLIGGLGKDTLKGDLGSDIYVVNITSLGALEDTVTDSTISGALGVDTIQLQGSYSGVVITLTAANTIENYDISATTDSLINVSGNASTNVLTGNNAANTLKGLTGNDVLLGLNGHDLLIGGAGNDVLTGGDGVDTFWFDTKASTTNVDTIADFKSSIDKLQFSKSLLSTAWTAGQFTTNDTRFCLNAPTTAKACLIYNTTNGQLSYDADGSATKSAVLLETLTGVPTITATDIWVV